MKIPANFRIDTSKDKPCYEGGFRHAEVKMTDDFGRHNGWRCKYCGHKTYIKRRKKQPAVKVIL